MMKIKLLRNPSTQLIGKRDFDLKEGQVGNVEDDFAELLIDRKLAVLAKDTDTDSQRSGRRDRLNAVPDGPSLAKTKEPTVAGDLQKKN